MKTAKHSKDWFKSQVQRTLKRMNFDEKRQAYRVSYVFVDTPKKAEHLFNLQSDTLSFEENRPRS